MVTDLAAWLRLRLGLKSAASPVSRQTRYWMLAMTLLLAAVSGTLVWEMINPVSMFHRGLIFGVGAAWMVIVAVFLFDLLVSRHGWCGRLCPVGAFYGLLGRFSGLRINAYRRNDCNDCMDCFAVCPEPQVIRPALKGVGDENSMVLDGMCSNCGRCIDVCAKQVFKFSSRYGKPADNGLETKGVNQ